MSEHTKGPWSMDGDTIRAANGLDIGVVYRGNRANGRLIAQVPDLYELAEWAYELLVGYFDGSADKERLAELYAVLERADYKCLHSYVQRIDEGEYEGVAAEKRTWWECAGCRTKFTEDDEIFDQVSAD